MSEISATLGNESRLTLMQLIAEGEKSVDLLSELSGLPVASTSQHLQVLKKAEMVVTRREGKHIFYRLQNGPIRELIDALHRFAVFRGLKTENGNAHGSGGIEPKELVQKLRAGKVTLVDVRSHEEFRKGHIPGAISLPFTELKQHTARLKKGGDIVVYCRGPHCVLSRHAIEWLRAKGIEALRLTSGFSEWNGGRTVRRND